MTIFKDSFPIARKEHRCMLCSGKITKGQRYYRLTCADDNTFYDLIVHKECIDIIDELGMHDDCDDEGLIDETFRANIDQYIYDNYPEESDRLDTMSYYDKICKILNDLKTERQQR